MSMYSTERQRKIKERERRMHTVRQLEGALAQSALLRIHEVLSEDPEATEITTPILRPEMAALKILKYAPEEVARRIHVGRAVSLMLDDTIEPPMLHISLGDTITDLTVER